MKILITSILLLSLSFTYSQLRLPSLVSSGMVLQQNDSVNIWGWAGPSDKVYVTTGWDNHKDSVITSSGARWKLKVKTPKAGGPYSVKISSHNQTITL
jgi:sialate O-acetylesterase